MLLSIDQAVATRYPDLSFAFFIADNLPPYDSEAAKARAEEDIVASVLGTFATREALENHPAAKAYAAFYKSMGLKPKKVSTPVQQALRVFDIKRYRSLYKIIDLCMKVEYTTLVSFQVYDLDKLKGDILYRFARENDTITTFYDETKSCKLGELILSDNESTLHSVYYGNNKAKSIDFKTTRTLIRIMCVPGFPQDVFDSAVSTFGKDADVGEPTILSKDSLSITL